MTPFDILAVLTTLAAVFAWVNYRYLKLPATIGIMIISLLFSLGLVVLGRAGLEIGGTMRPVLDAIDFNETLLNGMLGALLFAGALHVNVEELLQQKWVIAILATAGVLLATVIVGGLSFLIFNRIGLEIPLRYCMLFGALIAPTDPIAVGAILRKVGVPKSLLVKITGESLFNDGIGVVVFITILSVVAGGHDVSTKGVLELLGREVIGGIVYGLAIGWVAYRMLKSIDHYQVEILLTLAVVTGGYALALRFHISGALAMVVAGLMIGSRGRAHAMSKQTQERLDSFWELIDEFLNALLFVLIGVEVLVLDWNGTFLLAGAVAIPLILVARFVSVGLPVTLMRNWRKFSPHAVKLMTWSGLRGGISVALALAIPVGTERDLIITVTYIVVCFSIIVQGLTIGPVARMLGRGRSETA